MSRPLYVGRECKNTFSHVNAHQKVMLVEEDFNNRVDKMTCSVNNGQYPSSDTSIPSQLIHELMVSGMQAMHSLSNLHSPSQRLICLQSLLNAQYTSNRGQH